MNYSVTSVEKGEAALVLDGMASQPQRWTLPPILSDQDTRILRLLPVQRMVAAGFNQKFPFPHSEVEALPQEDGPGSVPCVMDLVLCRVSLDMGSTRHEILLQTHTCLLPNTPGERAFICLARPHLSVVVTWTWRNTCHL